MGSFWPSGKGFVVLFTRCRAYVGFDEPGVFHGRVAHLCELSYRAPASLMGTIKTYSKAPVFLSGFGEESFRPMWLSMILK